MIYFILFTVVFLLRLILKLNWILTIILLGLAFLLWPVHNKMRKKQKENEKRFLEAALYLDILLYAFLKEEKVEGALKDAVMTLPEGRMKSVAKESLYLLQMDYEDTNLMEESLERIEKEFPCKRIHDAHKFMVHVEYYGGEIERPVKLLLEDKRRWEERIKHMIAERKKKMTEILLSVVVSIIICGVILYLPVLNVDISNNWVIQIFSLVVLLVDDLVILRGQKFLTVDWLNLQLIEDEAYYCKKMNAYKNFDEEKEKRLSLVLGSVVLTGSIGCFVFGREWYCAIGLLLSVFFFLQHKVGKGLLRRRIIKEVKYAFPNWLLDLVLLLQSENVHMALQKSREHAPGILKEELLLLVERLEMEPESSEPYHLFLKDFSLPEVHSAMSGLYGISIGNAHHGDRQMSELIEKNMELLDREERQRMSDAGSGMYLLFIAPVMTASFKLVVDMALLMITFIHTPML